MMTKLNGGGELVTREEYIEDIKISLGAPVVDIEIEEILGKIVDKAFREMRKYITETHFVTVPYSSSGIDVRRYNINTVVQVLRTQNPTRSRDLADVYTLSAMNIGNNSPSNLLLSDYTARLQVTQIKNTMSTDLDFTFDSADQILYVNTVYPTPLEVTLVFLPQFKDVSEVLEDYWIDYIQRLSLALAKESLGRVRGKYELSSSLYKLDGDQLVSEGISERDAIRQELKENADTVFPMD